MANSPLFKAIETSSLAGRTSEKASSDKKENTNESKMMNENRIRAIIRHELIQAMKS